MTRSLHCQLEALEAHRVQFTRQLDALGSGVVHASPEPGAWSLAQLGEHLLRIDEGLEVSGASATFWGRVQSRIGSLVLRAVLSLPVRIPAPPSAKSVMPSDTPNWPEVREAWAALRSSWRPALVDMAPDAVVYHHPLAGPLCRDDALAFLRVHHRHHDAQVRRTLRQLDAHQLDQRTTATRRVTRTPSTSATSA